MSAAAIVPLVMADFRPQKLVSYEMCFVLDYKMYESHNLMTIL